MDNEEFSPTSLDAVLGNETSDAAEASTQESESDTDKDTEQVSEPEKGAETKTDDKDTGSTSEPDSDEELEGDEDKSTDEVAGLKAALKAERQKRQALEKAGQEASKQEQKRPSVFDDEAGYTESIKNDIKQAEVTATLKVSHSLLSDDIGEDAVAEIWEKFEPLMQDNPKLRADFRENNHPFKFAKKTVEDHQLLQKIQSGDMEQELNDRLEKMLEEKLAEAKKETGEEDKVPPSLAASGGKGVESNSYSGPASLESILALPNE